MYGEWELGTPPDAQSSPEISATNPSNIQGTSDPSGQDTTSLQQTIIEDQKDLSSTSSADLSQSFEVGQPTSQSTPIKSSPPRFDPTISPQKSSPTFHDSTTMEPEETVRSNENISGIPADMYTIPDISVSGTPKTMVGSATTTPQQPTVPQPGTSQATQSQERINKLVSEQDRLANERALNTGASQVLSPHATSPGLEKSSITPAKKLTPTRLYPDLPPEPDTPGSGTHHSFQNQSNQQLSPPQHTPTTPRLYPDLTPLLDPDANPQSMPRPSPPKPTRRSQLPADDPTIRRSKRNRRRPKRYGSED